ncbi:MAG: DUF1624 domain-containing protein [Myxococcales bacterium]|nr:MAG: DUF1624 domain-containing protein [Myxococcales bacterium]
MTPRRSDPGRSRLDAIDLLRGLVIVLMVLDHVRDFVHVGRHRGALDLATTTPALFATRWVTHVCAPTFVFLAGVSAWLQRARGKPGLPRFLATRGLWLIVLEATVLTAGWQFWRPRLLFLQVMWAIGVAMLALAGLCRLPARVVLAVGAVIVAGHNLLDPVGPAHLGPLGPLWTALHEGGVLVAEPVRVRVAYPVLPWVGVMALGFGAGPVFALDAPLRRRWLTRAGVLAVVAFVLLRALDAYGDPGHWQRHETPWKTLGDLVDVQKYPPSLLYVLMTLGPALLALPWLERARGPVAGVLVSFGRVPLFVYVAHIFVAHALAVLIAWAMGVPVAANVNALYAPTAASDAWGLSLPATYAVWALVVGLLVAPARWFAGLKARRRDWWLGYL